MELDIDQSDIEALINNGNIEEASVRLNSVISKCLSQFNVANNYGKDRYRNWLAIFYNLRGQVNYKLVKFNEAVDDYSNSLNYKNDFAAAYYNRGTILYRLGNFNEGLIDMQRSVQIDPQNKEFQQGLTECQRAHNELQNLT